MADDDEQKILEDYLKKIGSKGGRARAAKYDRKTLSKWAKLGGRPKKEARQRLLRCSWNIRRNDYTSQLGLLDITSVRHIFVAFQKQEIKLRNYPRVFAVPKRGVPRATIRKTVATPE
jgi:hypothetical protein